MSTWFPESPDDDSPGQSHRAARQQPESPPPPERDGLETQFLPPAHPGTAEPGGYGDPGYRSAAPPGTAAAASSYDAALSAGRRSGSAGPAPAYPDQHGGPGYGGQSYADQPYADQSYAGQPYAGQSYADPALQYADRAPQYADRAPQYPDPEYADPEYADPAPQYADLESQHADQSSGQPGGPASEGASGRPRGGELHGRAPGQSLGRMLAATAWPVVALGLFVPEAGSSAFGRIPAWSAFALACLVLVGVGAFGGPQGPGSGRTWTLGVVGACGLVAFWVLLVLPAISRNTSFALTLGVAFATAAVWLTPRRRVG
jgi:hypothetical protein